MQPENAIGGTYKHFVRGKNVKPSATMSVIRQQKSRGKLASYDRALRGFRYHEALDHAVESRDPVVVVSVLEELMHRHGLVTALSGRDEVTLEPLLGFLAKYTTHPKYAPLLIDVCK